MPAMSLVVVPGRAQRVTCPIIFLRIKAKMFDSGKDCHSTLDPQVEDDVEGKKFCHTKCENPGISPSSV